MEVSRVVHLAASAGDLPTLERVIRDTPALLEARNEHGRTPLMAAAKGGRLGAVELLLNDGAAIDERETGTFETALYKATSEGYWRVVELLLERGANCYLGDLSGVTPLMEAARKGYGRVTRCLLEHQQDRHRKGLVDAAVEVDDSGRSALWWSACWGNAAVLHLLLTKGEGATADLHRPDCHNVTPMHVTRRRPLRRRDLCGALLEVRPHSEPPLCV
jgi:ankyrin repeat protein